MPTSQPDDPISVAKHLAGCWKWLVRAVKWNLERKRSSANVQKQKPKCGTNSSPQNNVYLLQLLSQPQENLTTIITLNESNFVELLLLEEEEERRESEADVAECQQSVLLGLLYACIIYEPCSKEPAAEDISRLAEFECEVNTFIPSYIQLHTSIDMSTSTRKDPLLQLLDYMWSKLDKKNVGEFSRTIVSVISIISTRLDQLETLCRQRFLGGPFAWSFYRCVQSAGLLSTLSDIQTYFEAAFLHILLRLPPSTFVPDNEAALINEMCQFVAGPSDQTPSIFLAWLSERCHKIHTNPNDYEALDSQRLSILLSVLIFWRALCWVRVDGIFSEVLANSVDQKNEGLSTIAVAARQQAIRIVMQMWNYSPVSNIESRAIRCDDAARNLTTTDRYDEKYPFRRTVCLLMGRQLLFQLSDVGRITDIKPILEFLVQPCPYRWLLLVESAQQEDNNFSPALLQKSLSGTDGDQTKPECSELYLNELYNFLRRSLNTNDHSVDIIREGLIKQSIGLSFDTSIISTPNIRRPLSPPRIITLLNQKSQQERPIVMVLLMMIPASLELHSMMLELNLLNNLSYLSVEADSRTLRHQFHWLINNGTNQRPLDRLILRLPTIFTLFAQLHLIKGSKKTVVKPLMDQKTSGVCTASITLDSEDLWDSNLFGVSESREASSTSHQISCTNSSTQNPIQEASIPDMSGIGESELCRQLFLAMESASGIHSPAAISRARQALIEPLVFNRFSDAFKVYLQVGIKSSISSKGIKKDPNEPEKSCLTTASTLSSPEYNLIPVWTLCRVLQHNCLNDFHGTDMFCSWIYNLTLPLTCKQTTPLQLVTTNTTNPIVHPSLSSALHFLSVFVRKWFEQLGPVVKISLTLAFFEFCVQQLRTGNKLPNFDSGALSALSLVTLSPKLQVQQILTTYYTALCRETLVGRLLIFCGIEPQFSIPPQTTTASRGNFWLANAEARKALRFPLCGLSLLQELGLFEAPFTNSQFPVDLLLLDSLTDAFLLLALRLPTLWPSERLIAAVTAELNNSSVS